MKPDYIAPLLVALWVGLMIKMTATLRCPSDKYNLNGKNCCTKCPPGTGVVGGCTERNNTECKSCIFGQTYSPTHSHEDGCLRCSVCGPNAERVGYCNLTSDTKCQCKPHYFYDESLKKCRRCSSCDVGWGAKIMCRGSQDTVCQLCPDGSYSDQASPYGCRVCKICGHNQIMFQKCKKEQDTVCVDLRPLPSTPPSYLLYTKRVNKGSTSEHDRDIIPLYCAIMGAVIVGLLVYVVIKHWKKKSPETTNKRQTKGSHGNREAEFSNKKQGSDSGVYLDSDLKSVCSSTRIRDLPAMKKKVMEECFVSPTKGEPGSWDQLARELGYNNSRIASFELRAEQESQAPVYYLILEWGKSENATVGVLIKALKNIGRDDIVKLLNSESLTLSHFQLVPQPTHLHQHTHCVLLNAGPEGPHMV